MLIPRFLSLVCALGALGALGLVAGCARDPGPPVAAPTFTFLTDMAAFDAAAREGRLRFRQRDYRGAVESYERALAANPGDDQVLYFLAVASSRAGDAVAAQAWLGRLADTGSDLVPTADDFGELLDAPPVRTIVQRIAGHAARHRQATEAFRIPEPGLLAEGIAYDPVERAFYVGSTARRKLVKVVEGRPPEDIVRPELDAIGGVRIDAIRRRLWAVTGTDRRMDGFVASEPERNALVELDLETRTVVGLYRLTEPGAHGLNDVAIDARGRPFATDSAAGQIYTLGDDGRSLVPLFATPPYLRPNGLAFDERGTTLFVADATGIHRVDVAARTTTRLGQPRGKSLGIIDGLYVVPGPGAPRLVGIQALAGPGRVIAARLSPALDAVTDIEILESAHPLFDAPTTGAVVGSSIYVIANSQLWFAREPRETIILKTPLVSK